MATFFITSSIMVIAVLAARFLCGRLENAEKERLCSQRTYAECERPFGQPGD